MIGDRRASDTQATPGLAGKSAPRFKKRIHPECLSIIRTAAHWVVERADCLLVTEGLQHRGKVYLKSAEAARMLDAQHQS